MASRRQVSVVTTGYRPCSGCRGESNVASAPWHLREPLSGTELSCNVDEENQPQAGTGEKGERTAWLYLNDRTDFLTWKDPARLRIT